MHSTDIISDLAHTQHKCNDNYSTKFFKYEGYSPIIKNCPVGAYGMEPEGKGSSS